MSDAASALLRELRRFADQMDRNDAVRVEALEDERRQMRETVQRIIGELEGIPGTVSPGERAAGLKHPSNAHGGERLRQSALEFARAFGGSRRYSSLASDVRAHFGPSRPLRFNMAGQEPREDRDHLAPQPAGMTTHNKRQGRRGGTARKGR